MKAWYYGAIATRRRKFLIGIGGLLGLILLSGGVISWKVASQLVAPNQYSIGPAPDGLPAETIRLKSQSGCEIVGWNIRAKESKGVVILLHGMRGSRLSMLKRAKFLHRAGYSIVMVDLQAHGESQGEYITVGHLEKHDVAATVKFAKKSYPNQKIGIIGVSLGGAAALLASTLEIDAMVLESVYPNIRAAIQNRVQAQLGLFAKVPSEILLLQLKYRLGISTDELRPEEKLSQVTCPILIISGANDPHTTAQETERMYELVNSPKEIWLIERAGHEDLHLHSSNKYEKRILAFLSND